MPYSPAIPPTRAYVGHFEAISYADLGTSIGLTPDGSVPFTIEAWVRFAGLCEESCILSQDNGFMFCNTGNRLRASLPGFPSIYSNSVTTPLVAGSWTFVSFTFDGTNATLYIGGYAVGQQIIRGVPQSNNGGFRIGNNLQGDIQSVRIFNGARNSTQVLDDMFADHATIVAEPNLQADYDFGVYPPADHSTHNRPISQKSGAITVATTPGVILRGTAYAKPLHDHDVNPGGGGSDAYSVQSWILADLSLPTQHIFANDDLASDSGMALYLSYDTDSQQFFVKSQRGTSDNANILTSVSTIPLDEWVNVATTYDGTTLRIFINGLEDSSAAFGPLTVQAQSNLIIGASIEEGRPSGAHGIQGLIGNVAVWSKALSAAELQSYMSVYPERQSNLQGLYSFIQEPARNEVNGNPIGLTDGAFITHHVDKLPITAQTARPIPDFGSEFDGEDEESLLEPIDPAIVEEIRSSLNFTQFMDDIDDFADYRNLDTADDLAAYFPQDKIEDILKEIDKNWDFVIDSFRNNPLALAPITQHKINGFHVLIRHTRENSQVVFTAHEDTLDACTTWRISMLWTIISGLLAVFGVMAAISTRATNWINTNIIQNQSLMAALNANPRATVTVVFFNLSMLQSYGVLWPLFKMILTTLGWWVLAQLLVRIFSFLVGAGAAVTIAALVIAVGKIIYLFTQEPPNCPLVP